MPELKSAVDRFISDWYDASDPFMGDAELPYHVLVGDLLMQNLVLPMLDGVAVVDEDLLVRAFKFFEDMLDSGDSAVQNVVQVTIVESFGDSRARMANASRLMGPQTRQLSERVERHLGR